MLRNVARLEEVWKRTRPNSIISKAVQSFLDFLEKKLGAEVVFDLEKLPYQRSDFADLFEMAQSMQKQGTLLNLFPGEPLADEPPVHIWRAQFRDTKLENMASGLSYKDDRHALVTALAEALERHIWFESTDYFVSPVKRSIEEMGRHSFISPLRFAGIPEERRTNNRALSLEMNSIFLWIRARSFIDGNDIYVPAQVVCPISTLQRHGLLQQEPKIRNPVSTGLATHPSREISILSGALEVIERDAFMICWLNQISPRQIDVSELSAESATLSRLLDSCRRYRLKPQVAFLPTDAPTYALLVSVVDETLGSPRITFGLKAHPNLAHAAEGALLEALRARLSMRQNKHPATVEKKDVEHTNRIEYWAHGDRHEKLKFLISGPFVKRAVQDWERDSDPEHLERIRMWCQQSKYAMAVVDMTNSKANTTPWHVNMVVIPELQPMYFSETLPHTGGLRLRTIPERLGYVAREALFTNEPHPFV